MKTRSLTFLLLLLAASGAHAQQLTNLSFDKWSKDGRVWNADGWGSGNKGTIVLGKNVTEPEEEFVAVKGPGKKAARLRSEFIGVLGIGKFASASLFSGHFLDVVGMKGARLSFGLPFTGRPASLHGYYAFTPGKIDYTGDGMNSMKGKTDHGAIEVYVTVWDSPFVIDNTIGRGVSPEDEEVIGYGVLDLSAPTDGYVEFEIPIKYKNDKVPTHIGIMAASSRWGGTYTGSTDSILYLDEFELRY